MVIGGAFLQTGIKNKDKRARLSIHDITTTRGLRVYSVIKKKKCMHRGFGLVHTLITAMIQDKGMKSLVRA